MIRLEVPVDPDADQAQQWIVGELSKPEYQAAQPNWFDELVSRFVDWIAGLLRGAGGENSVPWWLILVLIVVVAVVVIAFVVFGVPRLNRRRRASGALFGESEERDAATLRRDAERAAAAGDYTTAIIELYRGLARGLAERTVVTTSPGTTALGFARRAAEAFPGAAPRLLAGAESFDGVRYLGRVGTEQQWLELSALERDLRQAKPALEAVTA